MRLYQLDGLRAFALLLVVLIHHSLLRSGWVGVDLFFVLSGFLITGILRHQVSTPNYWKSFYLKRSTRILPALLVLFLAAVLAAPAFKWGFLGYLFFAGNFLQLTTLNLALLSPLWSLAIEEHFYFLWPLAVRRFDREVLLRFSIAIVVLSPLIRLLGTLAFRHWAKTSTGWNNPIFLLTPFRIDGLAAGAALSLFLEQGRRPATLARWSGHASAMFAAAFFGLEFVDGSFRRTADSMLFNTLGYSLVVLASFFLVSYLVVSPTSTLARLFSSKLLVFIGSISYGFYLYEEGVIFAMRSLIGKTVSLKILFFPDLLITALIATASFYWLEKPIMAWGRARLFQSDVEVRSLPLDAAPQPSFSSNERGRAT